MARLLARLGLLIICLLSLNACQQRLYVIDPMLLDRPLDPGILNGTLDNGFSYYLRSANSSEQKRNIEIRMVVRTGSIHETGSELGYAHLLEHLVFRGTKNFTGLQIELLLEESGLRWGVDVNATTHYGATIYRFSLTENEADLLPAIMALGADFINAVSFDQHELEREKKIVAAEWRYRYGHRNFVVDPLVSAALKGSRYSSRPPVGDLKTVKNATIDSLAGFWRRHYRASNTALIVTGNIVPWEVEKLVVSKFGLLPKHPAPVTKKSTESFRPIKTAADVEHLAYVNPDIVSSRVSLNFISRVKQTDSVESLRERFREDLLFKTVGHMITARLSASGRCAAITPHSSMLESGQSVNGLQIDIAKTEYLSCLQGLSVVSRQLFKNGLIASEYDQLQHSFRTIAIDLANRYRGASPAEHAEQLSQLVVYETPVLAAALLESIYLEAIDSMNLVEFNNAMADIPGKYKSVYVASGPTNINLPNKELMALATETSGHTGFLAAASSQQVLHGALHPDQRFSDLVLENSETSKLKPIIDDENYREWQLSNGGRVIYLHDNRFDRVALVAVAAGGYLRQDKVLAKAARMLPKYMGVNGAGGYLQKSLQRLQAEKGLYSEIQVNATHHSILAHGHVDDVDFLLELVSAYFDEPVIAEPASSTLLERINSASEEFDSIRSFWRHSTGSDDVKLNSTAMRQARGLLFRTPADFTFVIVGNLDADVLQRELTRLERHSEKTIVGLKPDYLPADDSDAEEMVMDMPTEDGRQRINVSLFHSCTVPTAGNADTELNLQLLSDILERRLRYDIREDRGLSYHLDARLLTENIDRERRYHQVDYSVRSQDAMQAQVLVASVLNAIGQNGVTATELQFAVARERKRRRDLSFDYPGLAKELAYAAINDAPVRHRTLDGVSIEQLNEVAKCFSSDNTTIVTRSRVFNSSQVLSLD